MTKEGFELNPSGYEKICPSWTQCPDEFTDRAPFRDSTDNTRVLNETCAT